MTEQPLHHTIETTTEYFYSQITNDYYYLSTMSNIKFYVYILTNQLRTVLYTGVTNDLEQRIIEHWTDRGKNTSFTAQYHVFYLLYYEGYTYINDVIAREKEIKGWRREKKMQLINAFNPELKFLNEELFGKWPPEEITSRL